MTFGAVAGGEKSCLCMVEFLHHASLRRGVTARRDADGGEATARLAVPLRTGPPFVTPLATSYTPVAPDVLS